MNPEILLPQNQAEFLRHEKTAKVLDLSAVGYREVPTADKRRIYQLFLQANIGTTEIANRLTDGELVSAVGQFCQSAAVLSGGRIQIVIANEENSYTYEGARGNFIGAAFSFKNNVIEHWKGKRKQQKTDRQFNV